MITEPLQEAATRIWKDNESMQIKWLDAINWLRTRSTRGWVYDKEIRKDPDRLVKQYSV